MDSIEQYETNPVADHAQAARWREEIRKQREADEVEQQPEVKLRADEKAVVGCYLMVPPFLKVGGHSHDARGDGVVPAFLSWIGLPVPLSHWADELLPTCAQLMHDELLAGIGNDGHEYIQIGDCAIHFRRCCSAPEIEQLEAKGSWPRAQDRARWN